jgi:hypothetical protein
MKSQTQTLKHQVQELRTELKQANEKLYAWHAENKSLRRQNAELARNNEKCASELEETKSKLKVMQWDYDNANKRLREDYQKERERAQQDASDLTVAKTILAGMLIRGFHNNSIVWRPQDTAPNNMGESIHQQAQQKRNA